MPLATKYDAKSVEAGKYQRWLSELQFQAGDLTKSPFTIVIPPPNVTGKLHLGHAWDTTMQDLLIRYKKMKGFDALWLPGMDHAGIATQAKIEERLRKQGITRHQLGREKFLEKAWEWKHEYATFIRLQWEQLGLALDYSRERFTLDEGLSEAVKKTFVQLYHEGLIYQGLRIINWDPVQKTALSDIEVYHVEMESSMFYFKYIDATDSTRFLTVATTRPETMFGDVCVVVNPKDARNNGWIGATVINPANHQPLKVIGDEYVDPEFGTGAMKCTPAHDANDFVIGEKYGLDKPICMNPDGTVNELGGRFAGLDRFEARRQMVEMMRQEGTLVKIEKHVNQVAHSERSHAIIEPYLSKQWFVKMKPLAEEVLKQQDDPDKKINFYPERFDKTFRQWMENIQDWCISRQLWWGHRIPAWFHKDTGAIYVGMNAPEDSENYRQDEDVLDTWFSSALWPFTTLGWPSATDDLKRYYPTDVLVTGYDIIFFWVARMAFQAKHLTDSRPFKDVLIHGLIRDEQGRKMSKSLGNGVEPIDVIQKYGADTLRFFLTTNSAPGLDLRYQPDKVEAAWNFINKLWNASRFVLMNMGDVTTTETPEISSCSPIDTWILKKLNETIAAVDANMDKYEFVVVGNTLYHFVWDDFCSWYIEMSKIGLSSSDARVVDTTRRVLRYVLESILKMLHPFMPFVTDELYQALHGEDAQILMTPFAHSVSGLDGVSTLPMDTIIEIITHVRATRAEGKIPYATPIGLSLNLSDDTVHHFIDSHMDYLQRFTNLSSCTFTDDFSSLSGGHRFLLGVGEGYIQIPMLRSIEDEKAALQAEITRLQAEVERGQGMLSNPRFIEKAPADKVAAERQKLADYEAKLQSTIQRLNDL